MLLCANDGYYAIIYAIITVSRHAVRPVVAFAVKFHGIKGGIKHLIIRTGLTELMSKALSSLSRYNEKISFNRNFLYQN